MGIPLLRLETVHPMLVHFPIGLIPLVVLGYAIAAYRKSDRWMFVGDVALIVAATLTLLTATFGLVSNAVLPWPGGIGLWRWLHLGAGVLTTILFCGFAVARFAQRRRTTQSTAPAGHPAELRAKYAVQSLIMSVVLAAVVGFTGWVGGEVLVYSSGMAVEGAGDGALSPVSTGSGAPAGVADAMGRIRSAWASVQTDTATMLVEKPTDALFRDVRINAHRLSGLADWIASNAAAGEPHGEKDAERREHMAKMSQSLREAAAAVEQHAQEKNLELVLRANSDVEVACTDCHEHLRWKSGT